MTPENLGVNNECLKKLKLGVNNEYLEKTQMPIKSVNIISLVEKLQLRVIFDWWIKQGKFNWFLAQQSTPQIALC